MHWDTSDLFTYFPSEIKLFSHLKDNWVKTFLALEKEEANHDGIDHRYSSNAFLEKSDIGSAIEVFVCKVNSFHGPCHVKNNIPGM